MTNIHEKLTELLAGKTGTLKKLELRTKSAVPVGKERTGIISVIDYNGETMVSCMNEGYTKTSPVQSIESNDYNYQEGIRYVVFTTLTSTYSVTVFD